MSSAGIAVDEDLIWHGNFRPEEVNALCRERLCDPATRPDAVFCTNGPTALGVLRAFRDCGLRTPRDIAFATFDELTVDDLFSPSITTVVQPAYDIGFRAAQILLDRIEGLAKETESITVRLPATLKIRDSRGARDRLPIEDYVSNVFSAFLCGLSASARNLVFQKSY